jgi:hypothetical protein
MHIPPTKWGPHFWTTLHIACLACADYKSLVEFVEGYVYIIPCLSCRQHFEKVLEENPVPEAGDYFKWSVDVHNIVNVRLGKPEISYENALANLVANDQLQVKPEFDFKILIIILLVIIISVLILNSK